MAKRRSFHFTHDKKKGDMESQPELFIYSFARSIGTLAQNTVNEISNTKEWYGGSLGRKR